MARGVAGEVLVQGDRIVEVGPRVKHPAGAEVIDLGDRSYCGADRRTRAPVSASGRGGLADGAGVGAAAYDSGVARGIATI